MSGTYISRVSYGDPLSSFRYSSELSHLEIQEGVVSIDEDNDLGNADATLSFMGGTLSFLRPSSGNTVTLGAGRLLGVTGGTFDTRADVDVHSTMVGYGELRKIGDGMLDFRKVHASFFCRHVALGARLPADRRWNQSWPRRLDFLRRKPLSCSRRGAACLDTEHIR